MIVEKLNMIVPQIIQKAKLNDLISLKWNFSLSCTILPSPSSALFSRIPIRIPTIKHIMQRTTPIDRAHPRFNLQFFFSFTLLITFLPNFYAKWAIYDLKRSGIVNKWKNYAIKRREEVATRKIQAQCKCQPVSFEPLAYDVFCRYWNTFTSDSVSVKNNEEMLPKNETAYDHHFKWIHQHKKCIDLESWKS